MVKPTRLLFGIAILMASGSALAISHGLRTASSHHWDVAAALGYSKPAAHADHAKNGKSKTVSTDTKDDDHSDKKDSRSQQSDSANTQSDTQHDDVAGSDGETGGGGGSLDGHDHMLPYAQGIESRGEFTLSGASSGFGFGQDAFGGGAPGSGSPGSSNSGKGAASGGSDKGGKSPTGQGSNGQGANGPGANGPGSNGQGSGDPGQSPGGTDYANLPSSSSFTPPATDPSTGKPSDSPDVRVGLRVPAVPLPAALPLFGAAVAGLTVIGRKRARRSSRRD